MAEEARLGPYHLAVDPRGVRLQREGGNQTPMGLRVLIMFTLTEIISEPITFTISRIFQDSPEEVSVHGFTTDHVALDIRLRYKKEIDGLSMHCQMINSSEEMHLRFGVNMELIGEGDPRWLIPGFFYNENRVRDCKRIYPAYSEVQRDPAKFLANHWNFRSDRAATPVVFCTTYNLMAFLSVDEAVDVTEDRPHGRGVSSIGLSSEEGHPTLCMHAPYMEDPVKFSYCHDHRTDPEETFLHLEVNDPLILDMTLGFAPLKSDNDWVAIYRAIYDDKWIAHQLRPKLSSIEAERLAIDGLMRWHMDEPNGMIHETSAFDKHFGRRGTNFERQHMHVGWTSGVFPAFTILWYGRDTKNPEQVRAAQTVLDLITSEMAPCGTLWPMCTLEDGFGAGFGPDEGLSHSRTIAEAVLFLIRAFRLELQANTVHQNWFWAIQSNLKFIMSKQREDGAFPAYWYLDDGEPLSYAGASGMCWIAALAAFDHFVSSNVYREAAVRAAEYYAQFIEDDFIYGCVEDLPLVPTSDDGHLAAISYMILYETDHDERWLALAKHAAELAFTFRMSYNVSFLPQTMLSQVGFQTRGGDISSVATPILTPTGLLSFGEMRKISALTGEPYFEQRALEGRTYATQLIARVDGEFNARAGQAVGQIFYTDWWQPKGLVLSLSHAWSCALVVYVELIERTMTIPVAAIEGNQESIIAAATRSAVNLLESEIILPDPADIRRQRESQVGRRDSGFFPADDDIRTASPGIVQTDAPLLRRSQTVSRIGPTPSGGRRASMTPTPWSSTPAGRPAARRDDSRAPSENAPAAKRRSLHPSQSRFEDSPPEPPTHQHQGLAPAREEMPRKEFSRVPANDMMSPRSADDMWSMMGDDAPAASPRASSSRVQPPQRPITQQQVPGSRSPQRPPSRVNNTPPPDDRHSGSRHSRHVPLSDDDPDYDPWSAPLTDAMSDTDLNKAMEKPHSKPSQQNLPPPPELSGGLLSNLFDEEGPAIKFQEEKSSNFSPIDSFDTPKPTKKSRGSGEDKQRQSDEDVEIKWKIF